MRILHALTLCLILSLGSTQALADRVKDLTTVAAQRSNQLIGYGLVVGLQGTGDGDVAFTVQGIRSMLSRMGVGFDGPLSDFEQGSGGGKIDVKNVAAVMITAELPGFAKPGQKIDINVSALGKATSLRGGTLLMTPLRGVDGEVYALAQGALTATGVDEGNGGARVSTGVTTAARVPGGAQVEREVFNPFETAEHIVLNVRQPDFSTTHAIVDAINTQFGAGTAMALDSASIAVVAPETTSQRVGFMSLIENIEVQPGEPPARVVINARTGTVVISRNVRVSAAAVAHGTISVTIAATNEVSQPAPFSQGETTPLQNLNIGVQEPDKPMFLFQPGIDLRQIVDAVNQVGATPSALIAILEALKSSGSLRAELIVI
jgi:flagellar P-ring protein precursor FlgI